MPFKFWKKEEKKPPPPPAKKPEGKPAPKAAAKVVEAPPPAARKKTPEDVAAEIHKGLVDVGLTIEGTREVFKKRVAEQFGSLESFEKKVRGDAQGTVTRFIASWLGFEVPAKFELDELLYSANQRLSSFGIQVNAADEVYVDEAQGLREATFTFGDQTTVLQFQTPREVFREINEMVQDRGVRFIELEAWSDGYAFMLAKAPRWDTLARGDLVVVKADETATAGECPECGSRVGERWASCIACNTPLG